MSPSRIRQMYQGDGEQATAPYLSINGERALDDTLQALGGGCMEENLGFFDGQIGHTFQEPSRQVM
jgi:hypothetical protein